MGTIGASTEEGEGYQSLGLAAGVVREMPRECSMHVTDMSLIEPCTLFYTTVGQE